MVVYHQEGFILIVFTLSRLRRKRRRKRKCWFCCLRGGRGRRDGVEGEAREAGTFSAAFIEEKKKLLEVDP